MISYARQDAEESSAASPATDDHIAPAPRVSVQAFCETMETATAVQAAGEDRRLGKAHLKIQMGGMAAAVEAYRSAPTPNVIILETEGRGDILGGLDQLASVCDAGTRVVVIGRVNDVTLYRELVKRGVSDYVIAPVGAIDIVRSVAPGEAYQTLPFVRPGGEILLRISGWPKVERVFAAVDAVEALGIDPADAAPEHWRHVHNRLGAGYEPRPYSRDQHRAWLLRRVLS